MVAKWKVATIIGLTFTWAAVQKASFALTPEVQEKLAQTAKKSCNDDLDRGRFGNYGSIDECVADKTRKLERSYTIGQSAGQPADGSQTHHPN